MEERADKYHVVLLDHEGSKEPNPLQGIGFLTRVSLLLEREAYTGAQDREELLLVGLVLQGFRFIVDARLAGQGHQLGAGRQAQLRLDVAYAGVRKEMQA